MSGSVEPIVFIDGRYGVPQEDVLTRLVPGKERWDKGVFETLRMDHGRVAFWPEHWRRLQMGLRVYGIVCPFSHGELKEVLKGVIQRYQGTEGRLRLSVWGARKDQWAVALLPWRALRPEVYARGWTATWSGYRHPQSRTQRVKSLSYHPFGEARQEAARRGVHEIFLQAGDGRVIEGAATNIFCVRQNKILTPPVRDGCLNGVVRQRVLRFARREDWEVCCRSLFAGDLFAAGEIFVTNALIGVMAVTRLADKPIGAGREGPVARKLREIYQRYWQNTAREVV